MTRSSSTRPRSRSSSIVSLRSLRSSDRAPIEAILRATNVFNDAEIAVALELVDAPASAGYRFIVAEIDSTPIDARGRSLARATKPSTALPRVAGYACFGATPLTQGTFDLYWIAVDPALHGSGVGRALMQATEDAIRKESGRLMIIETASKPSYDKTRAFYVAWGCEEVARIRDFYTIGDDKVVYARRLA